MEMNNSSCPLPLIIIQGKYDCMLTQLCTCAAYLTVRLAFGVV